MLVLSRKKNESIVINNDIVVTVVEIRGDKVRLGIVAPKEVPVHRQEVYDAIHGKEAANGLGTGGASGEPVSATVGGTVGGSGQPRSEGAGAPMPMPAPVVVNSKPTEAPNRPV